MSHLPRRIVCAALMIDSEHCRGLIIAGVRHFDIVMVKQLHAIGYTPENPPKCFQGFIDSDYKFLHRNEAWEVAQLANQIHLHAGTRQGVLFSEDLY